MAEEEKQSTPDEAKAETTTGDDAKLAGGLSSGDSGAAAGETKAELQEKTVKKAFLEKFGFHKKEKGGDKAGNLSSTEAKGSPEAIAETLYKELSTIKGNDYLVLRVRKKMFVTLMGVLVFLMWAVLLGRIGIERYKPEWAVWNQAVMDQAILESVMPAPTAAAEALVRIRVRDNSGVDGAGQSLVDYLIASGYTTIELAADEGSDYSGLMVVVKPNQNTLREQLEGLLRERYITSSPSAELTADSDFDAVILYGEGVDMVASNSALATPTVAPSATPTARPTATAGASLQ